jgi:hypothetical protein
MNRKIAAYQPSSHGKVLMGGEPLVFHCNYYNYYLQKTLLLDELLGMEAVIHDAAYATARKQLEAAARELAVDSIEERRAIAESTFAQLGFGLIDLSAVDGGAVRLPMSHYGTCLRQASGAAFANPQSLFDAGFAAAATDFMMGRASFSRGEIAKCQSMGAPEGRVRLHARASGEPLAAPGQGAHAEAALPAPSTATSIDEPAILAALSGLDFSGNDEGLVPRFGVMLTHHYANFYNRISFEFVRKMEGTGLLEAGEELLVEAGLRCAFHTFGGIMTSGEWDAVVKPQCKTREDWVHGMVAVVNALGWGSWRVHDLVPGKRLVLRAYDDYESSGYLAMYGRAARPVSYLLAGGVAGLMNLVYVGNIESGPVLDYAAYERVFESAERFVPTQTKNFAMGDAYSEIVAER